MAKISYNAEPNPFIGAPGLATMHGDAQSSDTTPLAGPGTGDEWDVKNIDLGGACPTILTGADGFMQVLVTQRFGHNMTFLQPKVVLLDRYGTKTAELEIQRGSLLGGVYAFLDEKSRMVVVDGSNNLLRIAHSPNGDALWVDSRISLEGFLAQESADQVVGLVPDWQGRIWVASKHARVAVIDIENRSVRAISLGKNERVDNSISACPSGVSVITSKRIYMLNAETTGAPQIMWKAGYDNGTARKPGQLSWGSGATPTFFGPTGSDYVMLSDNADDRESVIVYNTKTGAEIDSAKLFNWGRSGTENSMIGIGNTIVGACTYGYPYPRYPEGAGKSEPETARFAPGMERWDIVDGKKLKNIWKRDDVYSSAVPRYSAADGLIYTCERKPGPLGVADGVVIDAVAIDINTGKTVHSQRLPGLVTVFGVDTLQMVGTIDKHNVWWQGTIGGVFRIAKKGH